MPPPVPAGCVPPSVRNKIRSEDARKYQVGQISSINRVFADLDDMNGGEYIEGSREKLESSLWKRYKRRKQTLREIVFKKHIWKVLRDVIEPHFANAYLAVGGSTVNSFGNRDSDLDLCLSIRGGEDNSYSERDAVPILYMVFQILKDKSFVRNIIFRDTARVPILMLELNFPYDNVHIDINCNCVAGIYNSHLLSYYGSIDPRVPVMVSFFKDWAKKERVIDPTHGRLNSYTTMLMVIHFLQVAVDPPILPNLNATHTDLFKGNVDIKDLRFDLLLQLPEIRKNERTVGELLYGMLNYYAQFDYRRFGISIVEARLFIRNSAGSRPLEEAQYLFFIEEVYDGLTVPKNLKKPHDLDDIIYKLTGCRDQLMIKMLGGVPRRLIRD